MDDATPHGKVSTPYGPAAGCPICQVIPLTAPHLCEHGVTPAPAAADLTTTITIADRGLYDRLLGITGGRPRGPQPPQSP